MYLCEKSLLINSFNFLGRSEYEYHKPNQEPIDPPYKESVLMRRSQKLQKPMTNTISGGQNTNSSSEIQFLKDFFEISMD